MKNSACAFPIPLTRLLALLAAAMLCCFQAVAQQTLGGITGEVTDATGGVIPNATVSLIDEQTSLTRTAKTSNAGTYSFVDLPIGVYTLTYSAPGYEAQKTPHITVQADRTATVNASLKVGQTTTTVEVDAAPLMNAVDTTNGYVMEQQQIGTVPLATGSFTGLAILSPGVNAELGGGTGSNSGLGNAPIWANGQRDTSNAFLVNGVDASNLFNGKSTSQVDSFRVVNNTGQANNAAGGVIPSAASIYLAIGNSMPTPAPETIAEVRVNASMYDAQQGSNSGAHIDMSTKSGTNLWHGGLYGHRGTNWINAAPFFFKKDDNIPADDKNPDLHRYIAGGDLGGPIFKNKLFGFISYQHLHIADQETGDELLDVPPGLAASNRGVSNIIQTAEDNWTTNIGYEQSSGFDPTFGGTFNNFGPGANPVGYYLLTAPALAGEPGNYLVPSQLPNANPNVYSPYNAFLPGTSRFTSDQAVADLDWNVSTKDVLAAKYYYQHDPSSSPYAYSNVPGFTARMDAGAQVGSINNVQTIGSSFSISETVGVLREKTYATNDQALSQTAVGMASGFGNYFPGFTINDAIGDQFDSSTGPLYGLVAPSLSIGPDAEYQSTNTGVFQNRIMPSGTAIWAKGRHSVSFGGSWSYTQLNMRDRRTGTGSVDSPDFVSFLDNWVTPYTTQLFTASTFLQGDANRYLRANTTGLFVQDKYQVAPNVSITAGLRYDWNGGLSEKNGNLFNFDPSLYCYSPISDSFTPPNGGASNSTDCTGFIIAGNNKNGTSGVSKTTLTGRQWGIAPRLGLAWQPSMFHSKFVVRAGSGFYYDRGELFTYLSPGYAAGEIEGGPFGIVQTPPFVTQQHCPYSSSFQAADPTFLYLNYIPICGGDDFTPPSGGEYTLSTPWGTSLGPGPSNPQASDIYNYLPNAEEIVDGTVTGSNTQQPFIVGVYNRANKLPYSINFTLNIQYQPRNDMMFEVGYVGNLGRHQVIPVPFNQAQIASPAHPINQGGKVLQDGTSVEQDFSYGYTVYNPNTYSPICVNLDPNCSYGPMMNNFEGGNVDLRVPYIGYSSESESYTAAGIAAYHALTSHLEQRLSHGFQAGVSYTFSHATDEQSGLGLFYNGNNPTNLRSGYGSADFDRTHVLNFTYGYTSPKLLNQSTLAGKIANSWGLQGIAIVQSGQPYSIIDYSGAVGSIYYSTFNGITNPIVPLAPGCTRKNALTGQSGAFYNPMTQTGAALKASCFTLPLIAVGDMGVPEGDPFETNFTTGQRNIFRQSWQRRADVSLAKDFPIHEQLNLHYTFDVFNVTNTASFDIPQNNVNQNEAFNNVPDQVGSGTGGYPTQAAPTNNCQSNPNGANTGFFNCPASLGITKHTISSPRQIQMSLHLDF